MIHKNKTLMFAMYGVLANACTSNFQPRTTLNGITNEKIVCTDYTSDVLEEVSRGLPNELLHGFDGPRGRFFLKHYAGIPREYQDYLIREAQKKVFTGFYLNPMPVTGSGSMVGFTRLTNHNEPVSVNINSNQNGAVEFSLQHETGHAVQNFIREFSRGSGIDLDEELKAVFSEAESNPHIRQYAKSNVREFFADSFSSYYCSPVSNTLMQRELPQTFKLLSFVLEAPVWSNAEKISDTPNVTGVSRGGPTDLIVTNTALKKVDGELRLIVYVDAAYSHTSSVQISMTNNDRIPMSFQVEPKSAWYAPVSEEYCNSDYAMLIVNGVEHLKYLQIDDKSGCAGNQ